MTSFYNGLQRGVERLFFKNKPTIWSKRVACMIGNTILMLILFYVVLNSIAYDWTGTLYAEGTGFRLDGWFGSLDAMIPFVPEMAVFYIWLFYGVVVFTMVYFGFFASERGEALGWSLVIINAIAILVYIVFPVSTYWYRQDLLAHPLVGNPWAQMMYDYYTTDTSFNCFPSLHAAVSTAAAYAWYRYARLKRMPIRSIMAIIMIVIAAGVILSTLFVKQHYIADEISGFALAYVVSRLLFDRLWKATPIEPQKSSSEPAHVQSPTQT
jgi:membrane-associated phospholipid phosphatase